MAARHFTDEELVTMIDNDNDGDDDRDPDFEPNGKEDGFSSSEEDQPADNIPQGETNRSRRRIRDPVSWKKNIRKRARNTGEEYTSLSNKKIPKKTLDHTDCGCIRKCCQKISQLRRLQLHESFWALGNWTAQNSFLVGLVKKSPVKRHDERDRRDRKQEHFVGPILTRPKQITRHYFLSNSDGTDIQVCKAFFLKTFSVSNG